MTSDCAPLAGVMAVAGLLLGPAVATFSSRRSAAQPLELALEEERSLLAEVLARPKAYAAVAELNPENLAVPAHRRIWQAVAVRGDAIIQGARAADEREAAIIAESIPDDLLISLEEDIDSPEDLDIVAQLRRSSRSQAATVSELAEWGSAVLGAFDDRTSCAGAVPPVPGPSAELPWVREVKKPSRARMLAVSLLTALGLGLVPVFVGHLSLDSHLAVALSGLALVVLTMTAVEIAVVDFDTFYVDFRVLGFGGVLSLALVVGATLATSQPRRLLAGLIAVAVFTMVEVVNLLYRWIRHRHGIGFGDSILLLVSIGIPAALTGSPRLGWYALIFSGVVAILGFVVLAIRHHATTKNPFAFGPYLALGWIVAWVVSLIWPRF